MQLSIYLPYIKTFPFLRPIIEGAIRLQAYFILSDPYANSFRCANDIESIPFTGVLSMALNTAETELCSADVLQAAVEKDT